MRRDQMFSSSCITTQIEEAISAHSFRLYVTFCIKTFGFIRVHRHTPTNTKLQPGAVKCYPFNKADGLQLYSSSAGTTDMFQVS